MSKRCYCITLNNRKCKKKATVICNKIKFCYIHANMHIKKYAIYIQKTYRAYHSRKYIERFKLIPRDIQCRILFYMRETHYINKYNKSLQKILCTKVDRIIGCPEDISFGIDPSIYMKDYKRNLLSMNMMTSFREHILKLSKLYKLYTKYMSITKDTYNTTLFNCSICIKKYTEERLYYSNYVLDPGAYYTVHQDIFTLDDLIEINEIMREMKSNIEYYKKMYLF